MPWFCMRKMLPCDVAPPRLWREFAEELDAIARGPRIVPSVQQGSHTSVSVEEGCQALFCLSNLLPPLSVAQKEQVSVALS